MLTLDQHEYDAADKVAVGKFALSKRVRPAQVRISLASPLRGVVEEMTVPFESRWTKQASSGSLTLVAPADLSRCRFEFNPSTLTIGPYECRSFLLDSEMRTIAECSVAFERVPDAK